MNINSDVLYQYQNGNCLVTIHSDGSKQREFDGAALPVYPESIDLKITDYCDIGCQFCHEKSTVAGIHAKPEAIAEILDGLPAGVEVAIGGGNPLSHPELDEVLAVIRNAGLLANLTVHAKHAEASVERLQEFQKEHLVHGIGVSGHGELGLWFLDPPTTYHYDGENETVTTPEKPLKNVVLHAIAGVTNPSDYALPHNSGSLKRDFPVLVLGYKQFGFGVEYYSDEVKDNLRRWKYWIGSILRNNVVSFDNLALKQLDVRRYLTDEEWNLQFMGNDGRFTMYVDAVKNEYAVSSTSPRFSRGKYRIDTMFGHVRSLTESI